MHPEIIQAKQSKQKAKPMIVHEDIASNKSSGAMPEEEHKPRVVNSNLDEDLLKNVPKGTYVHAHHLTN